MRGPYRPRDSYFVRRKFLQPRHQHRRPRRNARLFPSAHPFLRREIAARSVPRESFRAFSQPLRRAGLYLLDEPEAALSPSKQLALLCRMNELVRDGSQFIIATHSPLLMAFPGADILLFGEDIRPVAYRETEHYLLTRRFLNDPEGMLRALFQDEPLRAGRHRPRPKILGVIFIFGHRLVSLCCAGTSHLSFRLLFGHRDGLFHRQ